MGIFKSNSLEKKMVKSFGKGRDNKTQKKTKTANKNELLINDKEK